jgi:hypothetical protein
MEAELAAKWQSRKNPCNISHIAMNHAEYSLSILLGQDTQLSYSARLLGQATRPDYSVRLVGDAVGNAVHSRSV